MSDLYIIYDTTRFRAKGTCPFSKSCSTLQKQVCVKHSLNPDSPLTIHFKLHNPKTNATKPDSDPSDEFAPKKQKCMDIAKSKLAPELKKGDKLEVHVQVTEKTNSVAGVVAKEKLIYAPLAKKEEAWEKVKRIQAESMGVYI